MKSNEESTLINIVNGNIESINESDIAGLKSRIKEVEKKIKEKNKPKTITISGDMHQKLKKYCLTFNLNIGELVEKLISSEITKHNCIIIDDKSDDDIKEEMENQVMDRWINWENREKKLVKSDILINSKSLRFSGYSFIDGKPIYEFIGNNYDTFDKKDVEFKPVSESEISKNILYNIEIDNFKILD